MRKIPKAFDYLFLVRPVLFFPIWTVFFAGYITAKAQHGNGWSSAWLQAKIDLANPFLWISFMSITCIMGSVFIINQFTDVHSDRENNKLFLIANGVVSRKTAVGESIILCLIASIAAFLSDLYLALLLVFLFFITGYCYSLPPLLWKDRPFAGLFTNLIGGVLTFLVGWQTVQAVSLDAIWRSFPYVFAIGSVYFLTTIPDIKGDRNSQKITFSVKYGSRTTIFWGVGFEFICIVFSIWQQDPLILIPAILSLFFFLQLFWHQDMDHIIRATRFPILFLSLAVSVFLPIYVLLLLVIYLLSRWYYYQRFHIYYPNFSQIQEET